MEKNLIGIDGGDGSGKTTIAKHIGTQDGFNSVYFSEGNIFGPLRSTADQLTTRERFAYYLSINLMNYTRFEHLLTIPGDTIVMDRTPLSTFAYHEVMGYDVSKFDSIRDVLMSQFSQLLYVYADPITRENRMKNRLNTGQELSKSDMESLKFGTELNKAFRRILPKRSYILDTTNLSKEDSQNIGLSLIIP